MTQTSDEQKLVTQTKAANAKPPIPVRSPAELEALARLADLEGRVATLEQTSSDVDEDFLKASRHFDAHEAALTELKDRLDQLQPSYRHCAKCKRALRAASLKCGICGHQN